ncbi:hypothetical protein CcrColossus_gp437 [Caulobacter phage CcrColossus]|uniref:Uncharacterized protein n=1 Tax=Caulobacter phage CcrColossus TaxID=1211640 RepID=K4K6T5_9CAUD|nr:hypothetical protein CcrColossus_gp437 [Caulobacter phage CcrColossus]AFU88307.1 hypothetical protein CcrColossus_gp437 [Caulobacter phage CcrColossus]
MVTEMYTLRVTRPDAQTDSYIAPDLSWGVWDGGLLRVWSNGHAISATYSKGEWTEVAEERPIAGADGLTQTLRWSADAWRSKAQS